MSVCVCVCVCVFVCVCVCILGGLCVQPVGALVHPAPPGGLLVRPQQVLAHNITIILQLYDIVI